MKIKTFSLMSDEDGRFDQKYKTSQMTAIR